MTAKIECARSQITTLLFDFGGVIQELRDDLLARLIADYLKIPLVKFLPYYQETIPLVQSARLSEEGFFNNLSRLTKIHLPSSPEELFILPFIDGSHLYQSVIKVLEQLLQCNLEIAVVSNTIPSHAELNRKRGNYRWFGRNVFLSCEIGLLKPNADFFDYVARRLGKDQHQLILIDDMEENVLGAVSAGLKAIRHDSRTMEASELDWKLRTLVEQKV